MVAPMMIWTNDYADRGGIMVHLVRGLQMFLNRHTICNIPPPNLSGTSLRLPQFAKMPDRRKEWFDVGSVQDRMAKDFVNFHGAAKATFNSRKRCQPAGVW